MNRLRETLGFCFYFFIRLGVRKSTAVRHFPRHPTSTNKVVISIYKNEEYNTEGIFVVKVFTDTISCSL